MHRLSRSAFINIWQFLFDVFFLILTFIFSFLISKSFNNLNGIEDYFWLIIVFMPIWLFCMNNLGMYDKTTFKYHDRIFKNILFSTFFTGLIVASLIFLLKQIHFSRFFYCVFIILVVTLLTLERYLVIYFFDNIGGASVRNVIIVGTYGVANKFEYYIKKTEVQLNIVGYMHLSGRKPIKAENDLGSIECMEDVLRGHVVDEVIFALPKNYVSEVEKYVLQCEEMGITVSLVLELYDFKFSRSYLSSIGTLPMLTFHSVNLNSVQLLIKRSIDILGSIVGLFILLLISLALFPIIKFDSKGPVFFKQDRVGKNGRIFKLYKFRSMTVDAEEKKEELMVQNIISGNLMFKIKNDPRITRVGKFLRKTSLDELPQFINVLKGDMSLVGTRPPTVGEVENYENRHRRRVSIKPGITGMWQISGRSKITEFDEVVKLDTQYIDNWSVWLDFKIMLKTIFVVFAKKGAH